MVERVIPHELLTVQEYLEMEETASVRHEYVGGMVYATVGATKRHNRIAGNVYARLLAAARGGPCRVYMAAVKPRVEDVITTMTSWSPAAPRTTTRLSKMLLASLSR